MIVKQSVKPAFEGAKELAAVIAENSAASTDGNQATEELADMADDILSGVPEPVETPPQTEPAAPTENSADPLEQVRADLIALLGEADSTAALDTLERLMDEGEALGMDIDNDPDMLAASNHITQLLEGEQ